MPNVVARRGRVTGGGEAEGEHLARVGGIDDAVVPQARRRIVRAAFGFVLRENRRLERRLRCGIQRFAFGFVGFHAHGEQGRGGLLAAHDADARVRPHPEGLRREGAPAHPVVAGAETAADHNGELGHGGARHGRDQLGAVFRDAAAFVVFAHHEAGDVLQEHQRRPALRAQLDEVRAFERAFGEEDSVVGQDADRMPVDVREAADQRRAVAGLEFVKRSRRRCAR